MDKYIVYLTVNKVNGKVYVGVHTTTAPYKFDGYLGCGVWIRKNGGKFHNPKHAFHKAFNKYGSEAFSRITLMVCDSMEDALKEEEKIVVKDFVMSSKTYNEALGGNGCTTPGAMKKIHRYTLKGVFIESFDSIASAGRSVNPENPQSGASGISSVVNGKKPTSFGSQWSFKKMLRMPKQKEAKPVYMFNDKGDLIQSFVSAHKANHDLNTNNIYVYASRESKHMGYYFSFNKDFKIKI